MSDKSLEYYLSLAYKIEICKQGDTYILSIPELGLVQKGANADETYTRLLKDKDDSFRKLAEAGALRWVREPGTLTPTAATTGNRGFCTELSLYAAKTFIVIVASALIMIISGAVIRHSVEKGGKKLAAALDKQTDNVKRIGEKLHGVENRVKGIEEWTPEKVAMYQERTRAICGNLKPIFREIYQQLFVDTAEKTDAKK